MYFQCDVQFNGKKRSGHERAKDKVFQVEFAHGGMWVIGAEGGVGENCGVQIKEGPC